MHEDKAEDSVLDWLPGIPLETHLDLDFNQPVVKKKKKDFLFLIEEKNLNMVS